MGNKNGFDPSVTRGVQVYWERAERVTVVHSGGFLDRVDQGSVVLFETKREGEERMFCFGRTTNTAYWFVMHQPVSIFEVGNWFNHHQMMLDAHNGDLDEFCDIQRELPF
ncbi:hypothetical protein ACIP6T_15685 [Pantoea sp. NPDC088449]|uniref:hypothetical protein n=1 Tax=unclassified Pantoea TaxID=2630326 RepID=UPI0031F48297